MKNVFLQINKTISTYIPVFLFIVLAVPVFSGKSQAAGLAEEHTVLYYLIESQRQFGRRCDGVEFARVPSLLPSSSLRHLAEACSRSGQDLNTCSAQSGLAEVPFLSVTTHGSTAKQAFDSLMATQCRALMGQAYRYIGAALSPDGQWTVLMSAAEPRTTPFQASQEKDTQQPSPADAPVPVKPGAVTGSELSSDASEKPSATTRKGRRRESSEPAAPIVVGTMDLDYSGKPVGAVNWLSPGEIPAATNQVSPPTVTPVAPSLDRHLSGTPVTPPSAPPTVRSRTGVTPLEDTRAPTEKPQDTGVQAFGIFAEEDNNQTPPPAVSPYPPTGQGRGADLLGLVNDLRKQGQTCGRTLMPPVPPLKENSLLTTNANAHARDMSLRGFFSSTSPEGRGLGKRVAATGYNWEVVAENIANKTMRESEVLGRWLANENQCRNLMGKEFIDAGVGYAGEGLWVLILASPMEEGALRIE